MSRLTVLALVTLVGCGGSPPPATTPVPDDEPDAGATEPTEPTPAPAPATQARLIHAAIEARDQAVRLVGDDGASTAPAGFEFASAYAAMSPGAHEISAQAADTELIGASLSFGEGMSTIIAYSTADFPVALALAPDTASSPPAGSAQVRVFHALVGQGAIDVCLPGESARADGTPVVPNVALGAMGPAAGYATVAGGAELALQLRAQHATPCHGRALGIARFTPAEGSNYTLVVVGRTGRHRVAPELLFCADPPAADTSCASVAVDAH